MMHLVFLGSEKHFETASSSPRAPGGIFTGLTQERLGEPREIRGERLAFGLQQLDHLRLRSGLGSVGQHATARARWKFTFWRYRWRCSPGCAPDVRMPRAMWTSVSGRSGCPAAAELVAGFRNFLGDLDRVVANRPEWAGEFLPP